MSRRNHEQIEDSGEEAEEAREEVEVGEGLEGSSEGEGEDLLEDAERDYQSIERLDRYEDEGVDQEQHQLNPEARRAAEKELDRLHLEAQDMEVEAYMEDEDEEEDKKKWKYYEIAMEGLDHDYDEESICNYIDAEDQKGSFDRWINIDAVRQYIRHHFTKLLDKFMDRGRPIYREIIKDMVCENKQTLVLDYQHLKAVSERMATWLAFHPISFIPQLNAALFALICKTYPNYKEMKECFVRVFSLPVYDSLRTLSHSNLGQLVKIKGMVTTRSDVHNQLIKVMYKCYNCGLSKGPFHITTGLGMKPELGSCASCQSSGPFIPERIKSVYRNFQKITIQESPSQVPPGRIPRTKEAIVFGDIVDTVKPGDEIEITGIFQPRYECAVNIKQGFPVFSTFIQTNSIRHCDEINKFAEIDEQEFQKLPKMKNFEQRFYNSIAPSIFGHTRVKKALAMAMFGGVSKIKDNHRTRGDINVLLLGDPGVAKSQFLKSVQKVFPRCIYTTGKGASAVGLTASVKQDSQTKEWKLQAGALVLADKGICLIDQFDKMSEGDRTSIHEAMQQQTISISKAGIVANLNARCSVIAAANPFGGCYKQQLSFNENVNLTDPIISRFDIINVIKDKADSNLDGELSEFVIKEHMRSHPYFKEYMETKEVVEEKKEKGQFLQRSQDFIKQYIKYAREKYRPTFTAKSSLVIQRFYEVLRKDSRESGGVNIVARHLESMVRICEAYARMHLRNETTIEDAEFAISMMMHTFTETQKYSVAEKIRKNFEKYL